MPLLRSRSELPWTEPSSRAVVTARPKPRLVRGHGAVQARDGHDQVQPRAEGGEHHEGHLPRLFLATSMQSVEVLTRFEFAATCWGR